MEKKLLRDLESYKYDYQYFIEKSNDIDKLKNEIEKSITRLDRIKENNGDIGEINHQIQLIVDKQSQEEYALLKVITKKQEIEKYIDDLSQPYKNIFFLHYIGGYSFSDIALKMNYSTKRIYQLHKEGSEEYCMKQSHKVCQ